MAKTTVLHPASRKARRIVAKQHHDAKIQKRKKLRKSKADLKRAKLMWFKNHIPEDKQQLSVEELRSLVVKYLNRLKLGSKAEENEAANCSISMSVDMANEHVRHECQEFATTGLSVPDLTSKPNFEKLVQWSGETDKMISIPMIHVKKTQKSLS